MVQQNKILSDWLTGWRGGLVLSLIYFLTIALYLLTDAFYTFEHVYAIFHLGIFPLLGILVLFLTVKEIFQNPSLFSIISNGASLVIPILVIYSCWLSESSSWILQQNFMLGPKNGSKFNVQLPIDWPKSHP